MPTINCSIATLAHQRCLHQDLKSPKKRLPKRAILIKDKVLPFDETSCAWVNAWWDNLKLEMHTNAAEHIQCTRDDSDSA